jgi:dihydrofolate reductase
MAHRDERDERNGSVLWHVTMSLDGFIAGPHDAMDWVFDYTEPSEAVDEVIRSTGALLVGRRSYYVGRREEQIAAASEPYGGAWTGPQFVLTHEPPEPADDPSVTFVSGDMAELVERALEAAEGKNVVVIGATVARIAMDAGLVDEIVVHLAPVLLGDGVRLFERSGPPVKLERTSVADPGQVTDLWFRVLKDE